MFQNVSQNLGSIKEGSKKRLEFPYTDIASISKTITSCGCTVAEVNKERKVLIIDYTAKPVPQHLWGQGWYTICQNIDVTYTTIAEPTVEKEQRLSFVVTVVR